MNQKEDAAGGLFLRRGPVFWKEIQSPREAKRRDRGKTELGQRWSRAGGSPCPSRPPAVGSALGTGQHKSDGRRQEAMSGELLYWPSDKVWDSGFLSTSQEGTAYLPKSFRASRPQGQRQGLGGWVSRRWSL